MGKIGFHELFADAKGTFKKSLAQGDILFRQGDLADWVFSVERGELRLLRYTPDGQVFCLHTAGDGENFAEAALFTDIYHCNSEAGNDTVVWCYCRAEVLKRIEEDARCRGCKK
jgi:CRP-like cAMP-binding protein